MRFVSVHNRNNVYSSGMRHQWRPRRACRAAAVPEGEKTGNENDINGVSNVY
ncbi:Uncharacterized protein ChrSV_4569 [Chromobacterium vaccinii]|nr:Uncharacterized protein ChrSW_4569 [Chromobacterium vaccinii]QND92025.1 Uncharacterized protein ChrSV_4569 [Chromobacterium vaccinii]